MIYNNKKISESKGSVIRCRRLIQLTALCEWWDEPQLGWISSVRRDCSIKCHFQSFSPEEHWCSQCPHQHLSRGLFPGYSSAEQKMNESGFGKHTLLIAATQRTLISARPCPALAAPVTPWEASPQTALGCQKTFHAAGIAALLLRPAQAGNLKTETRADIALLVPCWRRWGCEKDICQQLLRHCIILLWDICWESVVKICSSGK